MRCPMWYCDVGDKAANDEIKGDRGVGKSIRLQKVKRISASPTRSYSPPGGGAHGSASSIHSCMLDAVGRLMHGEVRLNSHEVKPRHEDIHVSSQLQAPASHFPFATSWAVP